MNKATLCLCSMLLTYSTATAQIDPPKPFKVSAVDQYTFSEDLASQERELKNNPMLKFFEQERKKLSKDKFRPIYHYTNPELRLNDPNGLCYWQGKWHLFYQAYPKKDSRQHWGHAVSDDLTYWRDLPLAIYPGPEWACFSGSTMVEEDRVIAMYQGKKFGSMVAVSNDPLLLNWDKIKGNKAVMPLEFTDEEHRYADGERIKYRLADFNIWKKGEYYYAISGGTLPDKYSKRRLPAEFLFKSRDLINWEYMHPFMEHNIFSRLGDDGACPYFLPIANGKKHILIHYSHVSGAQYFLGDYDTNRDKFIATDHGNFNHGISGAGGVHAPSSFSDGNGGIITIFNTRCPAPINFMLKKYGWNDLMTLPVRLTLREDESSLNIEPAVDLNKLRDKCVKLDSFIVTPNNERVLENINGNAIEIVAKVDLKEANAFEIKVLASDNNQEYTTITLYKDRGYHTDHAALGKATSTAVLNTTYSSLLPEINTRAPEQADYFNSKDGLVDLQIFIDKSIVEVFINGNQYLCSRVYPTLDSSVNVTVKSIGSESEVKYLKKYDINSIWE